jgi:hypothetical protein
MERESQVECPLDSEGNFLYARIEVRWVGSVGKS